MSGPHAMPTCPSDTLRPMTRGSLCGGSMAVRMVRTPFISPEAPKPAMARPTMSMGDDGAAPQSTEPSSKVAKKTKKDH